MMYAPDRAIKKWCMMGKLVWQGDRGAHLRRPILPTGYVLYMVLRIGRMDAKNNTAYPDEVEISKTETCIRTP